MSEPQPGEQDPSRPAGEGGPYSETFSHNPVAARVPERLARGVLSTGLLVLDGPNEFVLNFIQGLSRPHQIVARVVLPPALMGQLIGATKANLEKYVQTFGPPPPLPPSPPQRPTLAEIFERFKLPDDLLSGAYANAVVIGHSATEFCFDFITGFYPTAAVSSRVYLSAPQVPRILDTLSMAREQFRQRYQQPQQQQPQQRPPQAPPESPGG